MAIEKSFSLRNWAGLITGISWGLVLSHFFASGDMRGPWLVILFGPPLVLLISPAKPILSWQVPVITAVVASSLTNRKPQGTLSMAFQEAATTWFICSLFSLPWYLIFHSRAQRVRARPETTRQPGPFVGIGVLVFAACALTILGYALALMPDSGNPGKQSAQFYGFLMATLGAGLSVVCYKWARKLGIAKGVSKILEPMLGLCSTVVILALIILSSTKFFATRTPVSPRLTVGIWAAFAAIQDLAILIWLNWIARSEQ